MGSERSSRVRARGPAPNAGPRDKPRELKHALDAGVVQAIGGRLLRVWPEFDRRAFESAALSGLDALEFKARAMQIADALAATLPARFDRCAALIERSLAPPWPAGQLGSPHPLRGGLEGWALWPVGEVIARQGQSQPQRALCVLHALTQRFTAEFAIRPFIEHHQQLTLNRLLDWTRDPSDHVRRLCSEGSRPRLPWAARLQALVADPSPALPILEALLDDPSAYVRRSVANHLNDIGKDHPALLAAWVEHHLRDLPQASSRRAERGRTLRHACRSLIKAGDARVLAAFGLAHGFDGRARLRRVTRHMVLGDGLDFEVELEATGPGPQRLEVDFAIHHVKAAGHRSPKVFKGWALEMLPGQHLTLRRHHPMRLLRSRRYHAGRHALDLRVNGQVLDHVDFDLTLAPG